MSERPIQIIKGRGTTMRPQARYDKDARAKLKALSDKLVRA